VSACFCGVFISIVLVDWLVCVSVVVLIFGLFWGEILTDIDGGVVFKNISIDSKEPQKIHPSRSSPPKYTHKPNQRNAPGPSVLSSRKILLGSLRPCFTKPSLLRATIGWTYSARSRPVGVCVGFWEGCLGGGECADFGERRWAGRQKCVRTDQGSPSVANR
jgi:hypothetical protein